MMQKNLLFVITILLFCSCKKDAVNPDPAPQPVEAYYYPPLTTNTWDTKTAASLGWNEAKLQEAFDYAGSKSTYGLILLQNGRIVKEQYWNNWTADTRYYIASAGKSVTAFVAGIAQQEGKININNKTSDYLGTGWTSEPLAKENLIKVVNNLTMTTGLDDNVPDPDCTDPACLQYKADAGTRWAYHDAAYYKVQDIIATATGMTYPAYCKAKLFNAIGMNTSFWLNKIMYCTTREAGRFGSLVLSKGKWENNTVLSDSIYFNNMITPSQQLNNSYGYLWWLNGKSSFRLPGSQINFTGSLFPDAPADMFMALGKDDKKIYVVPSLNIVLVRLGDAADATAAGPSTFDNLLWQKLRLAIGY